MNKIDKMEAAMRFVYAHFLEEGEEITDITGAFKDNLYDVRHIVRARLYWTMSATLKDVAAAENRITGKNIHRTTISKSTKKVCERKVPKKGIIEIDNLLQQFEDYWIGFESPILRSRVKFFNALPKHVLVWVLSISTENGYADASKIHGLCREFKTQSKNILNKIEEL